MTRLTIFTPTYNRATLLPRLYASLCRQTAREFEWLVVDDGSQDETEQIVQSWLGTSDFPIRYHKKENGGKHTAHNVALQMAKGELFFCVDSDDWLPDDAVEQILNRMCAMGPMDYVLMGYKTLENGEMICKPFHEQVNDLHEGFYQLCGRGIGGEYALVMRTALIRSRPFPAVLGERFSTEAVLYDRMELEGYTVCPCDGVLTVCEYQPDGLTSNIYASLLNSPTAYQIYHMQRVNLVRTWKERVRHAVQYQAFRRLSGNRMYCYTGRYGMLVSLAYLPGFLGAMYYKNRQKKR